MARQRYCFNFDMQRTAANDGVTADMMSITACIGTPLCTTVHVTP